MLNNTSFRPGHIRSAESIRKQVETIKRQFRDGLRKPPSVEWTPERIAIRTASMRKTQLARVPLGTTKLHKSAAGCIYKVVKISESGKWPYEHRVIMSKHLGRPLLKNELVHHLNKNTLDNRIENLHLTTPHLHHHIFHRHYGWSKKHDACVKCGDRTRKHCGYGLCSRCYQSKEINI